MSVPFTRLLGARSGVQLNPILDNSERFVAGDADQVFAVPGRFERGRIDKAFRVNRGNLFRKLGSPTSATVSRLNETLIHIYEAFLNGASEAIVYRLNVAGAVLNSMYVKADPVAANCLSTAASAPVGWAVTVKHLEAFNDGVTLEVNSQTTSTMTVRIKEKVTGLILFEATGSLDPTHKDEFGKSDFLPNVMASLTDDVEITVASGATIAIGSAFYGNNVDGTPKYVAADLSYFTEGGTGYANTDYDKAVTAFKYGDFSFGYMIGGGTQATALISKMIALGIDINKQFIWDVPGTLSASAAITYYNALSIDSHYSQAYWSPLLTDDPLNGGKDTIGVSGIQVGLRCARNARTDANGVAPKHFVVAGKDYALTRTGIVQKFTPTETELNDLAKARINPVIFVRYNSGSRYVFFDSLSGAKTEGDRKLIAVADMSSSVDDVVSSFAQEALQKPIDVAVAQISDFLKVYFEAIEAAGWIKPSKELGDRSFVATVQPNAQRPKDRVDVSYYLYYEGTTRAIYIQQTISK